MERGTSAGVRTGIWGKLKLVPYLSYWKLFLIWVAEGLGMVRNSDISRDLFKLYWSWGIIQRNELKICILPEAGRLENVVSGVPFISKLFSLFGGIDAVQTVALNQPFLGGNIAPNEKYSLVNPNGGQRYYNLNNIVFNPGDKWTISFAYTWYGNSDSYNLLLGVNNTSSVIGFRRVGSNSWFYGDNDGNRQEMGSTLNIIGKCAICCYVHDGVNCRLYVNGLYILTWGSSLTSKFILNSVYPISEPNKVSGKLFMLSLISLNKTPAQISQEYSLLRSYFPEIPSVTIGTQVWATSNLDVVCTPQGNVIVNVTDGANVEKITNGDITGSSVGWTLTAGWSYGTNNLIGIGTSTPAFQNTPLKSSYYYKCIVTVGEITSGKVSVYVGGLFTNLLVGLNTIYLQTPASPNTTLSVLGTNFTGSIDNVSIQQVGWSDSQNLYDYIYANTTGTTEQKTYAAVKAAAMWSYYNNDASIGAVYGKLYNWYAVKLLQMDIDYYNAANPSTPWGWRIPTQADFETLQTASGGASVAGKKLKANNSIWVTNTGTNESGLTLIPNGIRFDNTGAFSTIRTEAHIWDITEGNALNASRLLVAGSLDTTEISPGRPKNRGMSIRLIKS